MPSQEPQFAQKPDDPRRQGSSKYLKNKEIKIYETTRTQQKAQGGFKKLTLQLLKHWFNNFNKERVALFKMNDLGHQIRHLTLKRRHPLH
jgi:hypothetical protein